jgi:integrase
MEGAIPEELSRGDSSTCLTRCSHGPSMRGLPIRCSPGPSRTVRRTFLFPSGAPADGQKIEDFRMHDLRHTCASWMAMQGADVHIITTQLGTASGPSFP